MAKDNLKHRQPQPANEAGPEDAPEATERPSEAAADGSSDIGPAGGQWQDPAAAGAADAERISALEAEVSELKDQNLRALAEMENVRRRAQRDREEAAKYGAAGLARDLLTVADNLRRALDSLPEEARKGEQALANLLDGVAMVERELLAAFEKHGIRKVAPVGERFDHNLHQAMFEVENTGQQPGTVVQLLQPGYVMNGRLLRPAMVGVAKGEPAAPEGQKVDTKV